MSAEERNSLVNVWAVNPSMTMQVRWTRVLTHGEVCIPLLPEMKRNVASYQTYEG